MALRKATNEAAQAKRAATRARNSAANATQALHSDMDDDSDANVSPEDEVPVSVPFLCSAVIHVRYL